MIMEAPTTTLGERIKELRLGRGLSMRALAHGAGLKSVAFVADLEKGFRHPSPDVLAGIAQTLGVAVDELRGFDQRAPVAEIREMTERNPAWAVAFRRVVDAAERRGLTPDNVIAFVQEAEHQPRR